MDLENRVARRRLLCMATLGVVSAVAARPPVAAAAGGDTAGLRTMVAVEQVAIGLYAQLSSLPPEVSGSGSRIIAQLYAAARAHHATHAAEFNRLISGLGGSAQTEPDAALQAAMVTPGLAAVRGPIDALRLAASLEDVMVATQVALAASSADAGTVEALCVTAPVEAQHGAALRTLAAVLDAGAPELIAAPPNADALPASAGVAGIPVSFVSIAGARSPGEVAVP